METEKKKPRESVVMGVVAMTFFIIWGLVINWEYGWGARLQVGVTQGVISLVSTLFSAELIRWLVRSGEGRKRRVFYAGMIGWMIIYGLIAIAHVIAGTPELFLTMLPGLVIGVFFSFGYAFRVSRQLAVVR